MPGKVSRRRRHVRLGLLAGAAISPVISPLPASGQAVRNGVVEVASFDAPALGVRKRFLVYLPPSYAMARRRRYPVVYLLHGLTGNESDWVARGDLNVVADSLAARGGPELIVVMPDGDNSFYTNWNASPGLGACASDTTLGESATTFCVPSSRYGDYIAHDLVSHVDGTYRTIAGRAHRAVAGLSMGGTGALTLAFTYPQVFSAVASLSAPAAPLYLGTDRYGPPGRFAATMAEWERALGRPISTAWRARWGSDTSTWWRQDPMRAVRRLAAAGDSLPMIHIEVGTADPYLDHNRALDAALTAIGAAHQYVERPGGHNWAYWRAHVAGVLVWLADQIDPGGTRPQPR